MTWLENERSKVRKSHIVNLVSLALADGIIDKKEQSLLIKIATQTGMSSEEFEEILENPEMIKFYPPATKEEAAVQLLDLVLMMLADGKIQDTEMSFCSEIALKLGFPARKVDNIIETIIEDINRKIERELLIRKILAGSN
ncbi:MAG: hypothetical protein HUU54_15080 [Ignavibacteriaceae bacterium]|nr:hypothetical protein [Ignavibacteriaceae bacterium]